MGWIAGVDGCKAGWIAAFSDPEMRTPPVVEVFSSFAAIVDSAYAPETIAVDMPIGLPDRIVGAGRGPEQAVRAVLGRRASSVFTIPSREAVHAVTDPIQGMEAIAIAHRQAGDVASRTSSPPMRCTRQAFMIFPKIREIDGLLRDRPALRERVREVHPEVAFWTMNGERPLAFAKKEVEGAAERMALLAAQGIPPAALAQPAPSGAKRDDMLDALAGLVVAAHIAAGRGRPFPDPPGRDSHDIPIAIWTYRQIARLHRMPP